MISTGPRIALVGMYSGMWREFNPGCFMICLKTKQELEARLPGCQIDVYSVDNKKEFSGLERQEMHGIGINLFSRADQLALLENTLSKYDALILGGDIIWGGDDVIRDNPIFFLQSEKFLAGDKHKPAVIFNVVHTFYDERGMWNERAKFWQAADRAEYLAVRTMAIRERLRGFAIKNAEFVPDPVLALSPKSLGRNAVDLGGGDGRPILGISVRSRLAGDMIAALKRMDLNDWRVIVFPYSRQYGNLESVRAIKAQFGDRFEYIEQYADPIDSYHLVGKMDCCIHDTYHGAIASVIYGKPFVSIDVEPEWTSRKHGLLAALGINQRYNIRLEYDNPNNAHQLAVLIPELIDNPCRIVPAMFADAKSRIAKHYDRMAKIISELAPNPAPFMPVSRRQPKSSGKAISAKAAKIGHMDELKFYIDDIDVLEDRLRGMGGKMGVPYWVGNWYLESTRGHVRKIVQVGEKFSLLKLNKLEAGGYEFESEIPIENDDIRVRLLSVPKYNILHKDVRPWKVGGLSVDILVFKDISPFACINFREKDRDKANALAKALGLVGRSMEDPFIVLKRQQAGVPAYDDAVNGPLSASLIEAKL